MKILSKIKKSKPVTPEPEQGSVTKQTVDQHRDDVLSRGRRFKYPFQRSKHRVAISSILLVILAILLLSGSMVLQLYRWQGNGDFTYRVTQILPFPVAKADGSRVSYESYLFELRSALYWERTNGQIDLNSPDGKRQVDFYKRTALDKAMTNAIAKSLAKQNDITVSDEEVNEIVDRSTQVGSEKLGQILKDTYNFSESDMRRYFKDSILRRKVALKLDSDAPKEAANALAELKAGQTFAAVAGKYSDDTATKQAGGALGRLQKDSANLPKEVSEKLFSLPVNQPSDVITSTSGYFIVVVTAKIDDSTVEASLIRINPKTMAEILQEHRDQNKVVEYIKVPTFANQPTVTAPQPE